MVRDRMSKIMAAAPDLVIRKSTSTSASASPGPTAAAVPDPLGLDSAASPASSVAPPSFAPDPEGHHRTFSLSSIKSRTWRSFSRERDLTPDAANGSSHSRARRLSKSRPLSSSSSSRLDPPSHPDSLVVYDPANPGRPSFSPSDNASLAASSSACSVDWRSQHVEGAAPLETDAGLIKSKTPFLVATTDYLVKTKSRADALALFPALAADGRGREGRGSPPEPLFVIPMAAIVSVLPAESLRPSPGIEVWWRNPLSGHAFCRSEFFFKHLSERNEQLRHIVRAMRANQHDDDDGNGNGGGGGSSSSSGYARHCQGVEWMLYKVNEIEEPKFHHRKPEIFPVVPRGNTRKDYIPKPEDASKKSQEAPAFYLVVGTYLCHLVEIHRGKNGEPVCRHRSYGLVTLESFRAEWILHEERFIVTFR